MPSAGGYPQYLEGIEAPSGAYVDRRRPEWFWSASTILWGTARLRVQFLVFFCLTSWYDVGVSDPTPTIPYPQIIPAEYILSQYVRCQLQFVVARELVRSRAKSSIKDAYEESNVFVDAVLQGGQPLSLNAPPGWVNWPTYICSANAYAYLQPVQREYMVAMILAGQPVWVALASDYGEGGCEKSVYDDPEYQPEPGCIPSEVTTVGLSALAAFVGTIGLVFGIRALRSLASRKEKRS